MSIYDNNADTDIVDLSGNGKGVALNVPFHVPSSGDSGGTGGGTTIITGGTETGAIDLGSEGLTASSSALVNTGLLSEAWAALMATGGRIYLPPVSNLLLNNLILPPTSNTIALIAHTVTELHPNNPVDGTFMLDFDDGGAGGETLPEFYNIHVNGKITSGAQGKTFCGIRVGGSNNLILYNCKARYVNGCGWKFIRPYNAIIGLKTWRSGKADGSMFAMQMTGRTSDNLTFNDVAFDNASATEQDYYGWLFENGIKLRMPMTKVHGAPDGHTKRGIQIHRVTDYNCALWLTQGYSGNGFVHVSDQDNGSGITQKDASTSATARCSGRLLLQSQTDVQVKDGTGVTLDLVTIDLGTSSSGIIVDALMRPQTAPAGTSDYKQIGLAAPGNSSARIDLTRVFASDEVTTKLIDDRRTATTKKSLTPAASPPRPVETAYKVTGGTTRAVGEVVLAAFPGDSSAPPVNLLGCAFDTGSKGTRFAQPLGVLTATRYGAFSATTRIMLNCKPINAADASSNSTTAVLKRIQVACEGIASSYDGVNYWVLDIYDLNTLQQTLILARSPLSSSAGDGLPSAVNGNPTNGYLMDFWNGLITLNATKGHYISAILRPVGAPPSVTDCQISLFFELCE